jgi:large subunit ribosomal protein L17
MAASLFQHGAVRTTLIKAKEIRPFVERLITIARKNTLAARRQVVSILRDREMHRWDETEKDYVLEEKSVVQKLFTEIAPRYVDRPGGYTRIIHLPERRIGDAGKQVLLQLVEEAPAAAEDKTSATPVSARRKRAAKRAEAARTARQQAGQTKSEQPPQEEAQPEQPPAEKSEPESKGPEQAKPE